MFMTVLPHVVTLQKLSTSTDTSGGNVTSWATRTSGIVCLITQQGGSGVNGQTHTVTFPTNSTEATDVRAGDRIYVTTGPGYLSGKYLAITEIGQHGGVGRIDAYTRLQCVQVLDSYTPKV